MLSDDRRFSHDSCVLHFDNLRTQKSCGDMRVQRTGVDNFFGGRSLILRSTLSFFLRCFSIPHRRSSVGNPAVYSRLGGLGSHATCHLMHKPWKIPGVFPSAILVESSSSGDGLAAKLSAVYALAGLTVLLQCLLAVRPYF